jgi:hypothetical protein
MRASFSSPMAPTTRAPTLRYNLLDDAELI